MLSSTIFLFGASNSFFQNQYEFSVSYAHIVPPLLVLTMVSTLVIYLLLIFVRRIEWTEMAVAIVASLGVLFWIEGNFIPWKYGVFDGREMDWSSLYPIAGLELTLWLTVIILAVKYHKAVLHGRI